MTRILILLLLLSFGAAAQKNYATQIDEYLDGHEKVYEFNGAVLVAKKGEVVYKKAFGQANREWNVANTVDTKFRIGSLTKQFTSAAILQLAEEGKLKLDDPLSKYVRNFPKSDSVTIHMLLNHTSGIKSYTNMQKFGTVLTAPLSKDSIINFFKNEPYEFTPGTKYNYNNSGYFLLGYIIEKVSGQSYANYISQHLYSKAALSNTSVDVVEVILPKKASGYTKDFRGWQNAQYISMEFPYSAGAIVSTVEDLHSWNRALHTGKILSNDMYKKMTTPYLENYGYGLRIDSVDNHRRIGHSGGIPGFLSHNDYYPDQDIEVIVLSNNSSASTQIAGGIGAIMFDNKVIAPVKHTEAKLESSELSKYAGKYKGAKISLEIILKNDKLYRRSGYVDVLLKPESKTNFFYGDGTDRQLNFILNNKNEVTGVSFINYGVATELKKDSK
jgi:CubicO group peptidase (beta-lactamase class C family)